MKQVLIGILGLEIDFTTKIEDFIKHNGPKITYTKQPLQNEFFIRSNELLFDKGITDIDLNIHDWNGVPCFFKTGDKSAIPYDIFAASFYFLSRYEEYLPHVKDVHGRFPSEESVAVVNNFIKRPVVDIWAHCFFDALLERFPEIEKKKKQIKHLSLVDVTSSHCFAHKGFVRSISGVLIDIYQLKLRRVFQRFLVVLGFRKDPYDNFEELIVLHKKYNTNSLFFFQLADYSAFDKNVSIFKNKFRFLIKMVADYSKVSLIASYQSLSNIELLKEEKKRLMDIINKPIKKVRLRYNRVNIPETYAELVDAEFTEDYSMGYTHVEGFRAGTCTPFYFYDISHEQQLPIKVYPFAIHDYALLKYDKLNEIEAVVSELKAEVKNVGGDFITIFSNENFGEKKSKKLKRVYLKLIKEFDV